MRNFFLLAVCVALLSGCAANVIRNPDGSTIARGKVGTNTGVELTATGDAANIVAGNLASVPGAPPGWNENGEVTPIGPSGKLLAAAPYGQSSSLHLVVGENQTKGLGLVVTGFVSKFLTDAYEAVELGKQAVDSTAIREGTKAAKIAADKDVAIKTIEAEAAAHATTPTP